jgi:hypothetical protein
VINPPLLVQKSHAQLIPGEGALEILCTTWIAGQRWSMEEISGSPVLLNRVEAAK